MPSLCYPDDLSKEKLSNVLGKQILHAVNDN